MHDLVGKLKLARIGDNLARRNPLAYPRIRRLFARLERADFQTCDMFTRKRLATTLGWAMTTSYGKAVGGSLDVEAWPFLEKDTVRANSTAFHTSRILPVISASTSGTTGQPLNLARSIWSIAAEQAAIDMAASKLGVEMSTARIAVLRADSIKNPSDKSPPYWLLANGGRRLICSSYHLSVDTLPHFITELNTFDPEILWVYPTTLDSLCRLLSRSGRQLYIRTVLSSSEMLFTATWRNAEATLGCRLVDYYGQAERVAFALASEPGKYRFLPGYAHVELIHNSSDASYAYYEIVGTPLWNRAMPLVRYRSGDLAQLPIGLTNQELQQVASGKTEFPGIVGRSNDHLVLSDGARIAGLNHLPRGVNHLLRMQLIQDSVDSVRILVLTTAEFEARDEEHLLQNVRTKIPGSIDVKICRVDELERVASGKAPFVIHGPAVRGLVEAASNMAASQNGL